MEKYNLIKVSTYAHGVGPDVEALFNDDFVERTKQTGMLIHPWYVRDEQLDFTSSPITENIAMLEAKVDGLFTEYPHMTLSSFELMLK